MLAVTHPAALLRVMGWELTEVTVNECSGFARVIVERRDWSTGRGRIVLLQRSVHGGIVSETRETTSLVAGAFRHHWEIDHDGLLGRRRCEGFRSALRQLATYIDDNRSPGSRALGRQAMRAIAEVSAS